MNIIKPLPVPDDWKPHSRSKLIYVPELDAYIQEDLLPDILRIAAEENQEGV